MMIKITFPDGSVREYEQGVSAYQIAESISPRLAADVIVASVNGEIYDLDRPINSDAQLKLHKWEDEKVSESTLPDLVAEIKSKTFAIAQGKQSGNHGKFDNRLKKLFEVQPATFDQFAAWWPEDLCC